MTRRDLISRVPLILIARRIPAQVGGLFRNGYDTIVIQTTKTTGWHPSFSKVAGSQNFYWKFPDGTYASNSGNFTVTLPAGTKTILCQKQDGFRTMSFCTLTGQQMVGPLPNLSHCGAALLQISLNTNSFTGVIPAYYGTQFTSLNRLDLGTNSLTGSIPTFAASAALLNLLLGGNSLSGTVPSFAGCTGLTGAVFTGNAGINDSAAGSWATQKSLDTLSFNTCGLSSTAVNQVLADCVVSLGIGGRVICTLSLNGGTNAAPTGLGITNKGLLIAAGWSVPTN